MTGLLKQVVLAATVAAAVAVGVPDAHAAVVRAGCGFDSISQATVTGEETFTGEAYGYAVFDDQGTHSLRCYVTVDGSEQATTPTQSGSAFVSTAGQVTYSAAEGSQVELCTEVDGSTTGCAAADEQQFLPAEVEDLLCSLTRRRSDCPPYSTIAWVRDHLPLP
jgi:hypothetical protein